jgi:hypothetical protein
MDTQLPAYPAASAPVEVEAGSTEERARIDRMSLLFPNQAAWA